MKASTHSASAHELGRLEQLVLRGDGLTTTSLEILTSSEISVRVRHHWQFTLSDDVPQRCSVAADYTGLSGPDLSEPAEIALRVLEADIGSPLVVREVLLTSDTGEIYAAASVVAVLNRLSTPLAYELATTDVPIGKLLRRSGIFVTRELQFWGTLPAEERAPYLGVTALDLVPARRYVMRLSSSGQLLAAFSEWFAPRLFGEGKGGETLTS